MSTLSPFPVQNAKGLDPILIQWFTQFLKPRVDKSLEGVALSGDVTGSGSSSVEVIINPGAVTLGKMAGLPTHTIMGNAASDTEAPQALTSAMVTALLNVFTAVLQGLVPPSGGGTTAYLRADGTWNVPPAAGPAAGDLSGTYPSPGVAGLMAKALPALTVGNLRYNGSAWVMDATAYALDSAVVHTTGPETVAGLKTFSTAPSAPGYQVSSVQVLTSQQAGLGATLGAATLSGTYATDLATLQTLYNKVLALETKLKVHGLVAT